MLNSYWIKRKPEISNFHIVTLSIPSYALPGIVLLIRG
jgi:hypothetical protein